MEDLVFIVNEVGAENASMIPLKNHHPLNDLEVNRDLQKDAHARVRHVTILHHHPIGDVTDLAIVAKVTINPSLIFSMKITDVTFCNCC